jgi:putative addiction module component (TIGR02574 family)
MPDQDSETGAEQALCEEIERRIASLQTGAATLVPWEQVEARLTQRFRH